ncbi:MAG: polyprenyl synthetase family protein [Chloroflexi bacterium]|nr:polyprenyl synthetase family protein [Chloroflexota bacterium]
MPATAEQQVTALQQRFTDDIQATLRAAIAGSESELSPLLRYHLGWEAKDGRASTEGGGKALRPVLCLAACDLAGGDWRKALPAAAALELVHNFSLIHDDIQDRDTTRRGRGTLWAIHGEPKAVSAGNAMRVIADKTLMSLAGAGLAPKVVVDVAAELTERYLEMIEGQYMDMSFETSDDVTVDEYLDMVGRKTGALIESAMYMGALVATGDLDTARAFGTCGRRLGLAFQIRDDFLGIWGDPSATGKAVGADIRRKKKSMPVIHLFQQSTGEDRDWLNQAYAGDGEVAGEDVERILVQLDRLGTPEHVQAAATGHAAQAVEEIHAFGLAGEAEQTVKAMAEFFVTREK